ncbi:hypothetical protein [Chryseobacterium kimseyorum]|nr:hypothetical protein [Chryseobacterium kimseyorum]
MIRIIFLDIFARIFNNISSITILQQHMHHHFRSQIINKIIFGALFFFYLISGSVMAQSLKNPKETPKAEITLKGGAVITSTDGAFNKQITTDKIIRDKKTEITFNKNGESREIMTFTEQESKMAKSKMKVDDKNKAKTDSLRSVMENKNKKVNILREES